MEYGVTKQSFHKEKQNRLGVFFETNLGEFEVELFVKICSKEVWHFVNIAEGREETKLRGYSFGGLTFHQAVEGNLIYTSCPIGEVPMPSEFKKFGNDLATGLRHDSLGILCQKAADNTLGHDQYYLTMSKSENRDTSPAVIGVVTKGRDVVERIGTFHIELGKKNKQHTSAKEVVIKSVKIIRNWKKRS